MVSIVHDDDPIWSVIISVALLQRHSHERCEILRQRLIVRDLQALIEPAVLEIHRADPLVEACAATDEVDRTAGLSTAGKEAGGAFEHFDAIYVGSVEDAIDPKSVA